MDNIHGAIFPFFIFILLNLQMSHIVASDDQLQTYIVHVQMPHNQISTQEFSENLESWYESFLPATLTTSSGDQEPSPRLVYSYRHIFSGFAAKLTPIQVEAMEKMEGFLSAKPQRVITLHTTHSPRFLGLSGQSRGLWRGSNYGKGVIIGLLDTGIRPEHPSFNDEGMPPPPAKWKGSCEIDFAAHCNRKLIGARSFEGGNGTPMDFVGHGTHTSGTVAGNFVKGAGVFGQANGTAAGVAPLSHIAMYNVCPSGACSESSTLAAMDMSIHDGVDVLSISLASTGSSAYYDDNIAIGAFSAMEKGIFVSCSAGNSGPFLASVSNVAPWILTVGASTINRKIKATALLGNRKQFNGESFFQPKSFKSTQRILIFPNRTSPYCTAATLKSINIKEKIVLCVVGGGVPAVSKGLAVQNAGGAAMILMNDVYLANTTSASAHVLPATHVSYADGLNIIKYIDSTTTPTATIIFKGTIIGGDNHAPVVAAFSSRGPNAASPGILKPDIIGPGVNILAAWPYSVENNFNSAGLNFNFLSGTSMSCPHLSGVAALLKSAHPSWSPAAIKSAMMTTADIVNLKGNRIEDETFHPADIFAVGSGHINPSRANNPGLVYDLQPTDYIPYLCGLSYSNHEVSIIVNHNVNCSRESRISDSQLNYPSFSVILGKNARTQTYSRKVTNVGGAQTNYIAHVIKPRDVVVKVEPTMLNFTKLNQVLTYKVTFSRSVTNATADFAHGYLTWTSTKYSVRSPIVVLLS
ncbi:serine protease [Lithospermum erythrorhizon]|uniref:Serine protease n=1 Tax=Lithospermum erythrorhizon TaxID=34254 RepID=A0AAV3RAV0_LITER